jgi:hypothetical protein
MSVVEAATSLGGSPANQFLELLDPADEPFIFPAGYRLAVYDGAGVSVGNQSLGSGVAIVDGGAPMLVARGTVGAAPHQALTVNLPTAAGQACFERGNGDRIHCLRWGTIANPVGSLAASGPAPADGQSLQVCGAEANLGAPTPRAANVCTGGGPGPTPVPARDRTRPTIAVTVPRRSLALARVTGVPVRVRSNEAGRARARLLRAGRLLRTRTGALAANRTRTFALALPRGATRGTYRVLVRVTDAAGNFRDATRFVTLT